VVLVVLFHAGYTWFPGGYVGVDVFFVISGFLITGLLSDEALRTGRVSIPGFYARRARRLLPMSTLVLVCTVVLSLWLLPRIDLANVGQSALAAGLFVANMFFSSASGNYLAGDLNGNPFLHYWSLSVEEQFYVIWPLLIIAAAHGWPGPKTRRTPKAMLRRMALSLAVLGTASLVWSIIWTARDGSSAYFALSTRAWELAAGAGLALVGPHLSRLPRLPAVLGGYLGLAMVLWSALFLSTATPMPGSAAALPVLGTVLLLAAGARFGSAGVPRLLSWPALRYVGRISYAWYLWHWPVLVLAVSASGAALTDGGSGRLSWPWLIMAVLGSFALAAASSRFVETPVRQSRALRGSVRRSLLLAAALVSVGAVGSLPFALSGASHTSGAKDPVSARQDLPHPSADPCNVSYDPTAAPPPSVCQRGDPKGTISVVLLGDSHADQWIPALVVLAAQKHWRLYTWTKSLCPAEAVVTWFKNTHPYDACTAWRASVRQRLSQIGHIDLILVGRIADLQDAIRIGGRLVSRAASPGPWATASHQMFLDLGRIATHVVVLRDTPLPRFDVPGCLSAHSADRCSFLRSRGVDLDRLLYQAERAAATDAVSFVDLNNLICPPAPRCTVVNAAGLIEYRDANHLTASYVTSIAPQLAAQIQIVLAGHRTVSH
jgi:peptidoglycan/LPS O-acetylase OafA/YrhL